MLIAGWVAKPTVTGHSGPVMDLTWDSERNYIISVSSDQTARLFAPWTKAGSSQLSPIFLEQSLEMTFPLSHRFKGFAVVRDRQATDPWLRFELPLCSPRAHASFCLGGRRKGGSCIPGSSALLQDAGEHLDGGKRRSSRGQSGASVTS